MKLTSLSLCTEVGIYKRKQENKKSTKKAIKKTKKKKEENKNSTKKVIKKKRKFFLFFLGLFLGRVLVFFLVFLFS